MRTRQMHISLLDWNLSSLDVI